MKIFKKLPEDNKEKAKDLVVKLRDLYDKREKLLRDFQKIIENHISDFDKLNEMCNTPLGNLKFIPRSKMVVNLKDKFVAEEDSLENFCVCNDCAYGSMICCDNPMCEIRWYHFKCVGIINAPRDSWICSYCKERGYYEEMVEFEKEIN